MYDEASVDDLLNKIVEGYEMTDRSQGEFLTDEMHEEVVRRANPIERNEVIEHLFEFRKAVEDSIKAKKDGDLDAQVDAAYKANCSRYAIVLKTR